MKNILIIGCGLIGSSLLRRIKKKKLAKKIFIFEAYNKLCFTDWETNFVSLRDSTAASWATSLTLNGGFIKFKASTIFLGPYPQPIRKEANPYIFENVLKMKTFFLFLNKSRPDL